MTVPTWKPDPILVEAVSLDTGLHCAEVADMLIRRVRRLIDDGELGLDIMRRLNPRRDDSNRCPVCHRPPLD